MVPSPPSKPSGPSAPGPPCSRCILYRDESQSVFLVDIPASIEESQVLPAQSAETARDRGGGGGGPRRLLSVDPVAAPYPLPEPRNPQHNSQGTPASQLADLMTEAAVRSALDALREHHTAPFCLPRVTAGVSITSCCSSGKSSSGGNGSACRSLQDDPAREDAARGAIEPEAAAAAHFIPEGSAYLCGSIADTREAFITTAPVFDLMIMDPPWPNKSAKRKTGGYSTVYGLKETRRLLEQIPVAAHLAEDGIVAVWVTNRPSLVDLLTSPNGVLAAWGLEVVAEWIWIKITSQGEPIFDTGSSWRKPWERLIIARRRGSARKIPQRVLAAVPDVHSRKPNLRCLFEDLLPRGFVGLEVFARNLTAGWWAWGNQVLRFQEPRYWVAPTESGETEVEESSEQNNTN
ncbi:MT-a70 family protein [Colletotrichum plurivorum]|uniref:MT-a70 family protein n=1 Tax=Colletotrichum plurivorum TaxID=2175906 RepID=A0A8H6NT94_9PEZI|nr:MT-a70 family protein [Colletotrichum plurivorum]